jgi:hypothetical protein
MRSTSRRLQAVAVLLGALLVLLAARRLPPAHSASSTILITAVYYGTYLTGEPDEALGLMNVSDVPVDLTDRPIQADRQSSEQMTFFAQDRVSVSQQK